MRRFAVRVPGNGDSVNCLERFMNHYFASDIHLGAGGEAFAGETERRFVAWLDDAAKDAE